MKTIEAHTFLGVEYNEDNHKNGRGEIINYEVVEKRNDESDVFLAAIDENYVLPQDTAMSVAMALDARIRTPVLLWGFHGSGKSTLAEQVSARLGRPCIRVQHSVDTEASDIVGQWTLEGSETKFHYGPLARAMILGLVYIADEYDFALPNVLAIYQAVLEGAPLFIKQAPADMAIVRPHKDFRFIATGNTNGGGDETGLYQGTQIQNAANYSRFGLTLKVDYQKPEVEREILIKRVGNLPKQDTDRLLEFTRLVRDAYAKQEITNTISTREIITISNLAVAKGRKTPDWIYGITHGFINRMSTIDGAAIQNIANRVFG